MESVVLANIVGPDGLVVLIVVLIVLLFGGSQLPKLARSLGGASHELRKASQEFKAGVAEGDPSVETTSASTPAAPTPTPTASTPPAPAPQPTPSVSEPKDESGGLA